MQCSSRMWCGVTGYLVTHILRQHSGCTVEGARNRSFLDPSPWRWDHNALSKCWDRDTQWHHITYQNRTLNRIISTHSLSRGGEYKWKRLKINKDNYCVKVKEWQFHGTAYNLTFPPNELVGSVWCVSNCVSKHGTNFGYRKIQFFLYSHIINSLN